MMDRKGFKFFGKDPNKPHCPPIKDYSICILTAQVKSSILPVNVFDSPERFMEQWKTAVSALYISALFGKWVPVDSRFFMILKKADTAVFHCRAV